MIYLNFFLPIATTTPDSFYLPVPCRGIVKDVWMAHDKESDTDEIWTVARGATAVNTVTPSADEVAGVSVQGEPTDSANKDLIFDPESSEVTYRVIKINTLNTVDAGGNLGVFIAYDDSAAVLQKASEAVA